MNCQDTLGLCRRPAMDYAYLRKEGIRHLERMNGRLWTDFNAHDPGITILEQVCYAITDLGYRISFELPDLLAEGGEDWAKDLYRPSEVLTTQPVTLTDMRKLAMDVEGVKNAWIERVEEPTPPLYYHPGKNELSLQEEPPASQSVQLKGLYRVLIEKSDLTDIDGTIVKQAVMHRLHAQRGLCEDFAEIRVLDDLNIKVDARIEIGPVEDAEKLLVDIYERLANYISPRIPFLNLAEMLAAGKSVDEIFEGPMLKHGFIDTQALEGLQRRVAIYSSDLIREIMLVDGVRAVRYINLGLGNQWDAWSLKWHDRYKSPKLDLHNSPIVLQHEQLEVGIDAAKAIDSYEARLKRSTLFNPLSRRERDIVPPAGRRRNVGHYHSIQHQFPRVFGVGPAGLSQSTSSQRQAQAHQLKAYLMFFDQLLANYFAQLTQASDLFSFEGHGARTYFSNMIDDPQLDLDPIRRQGAEDHRESLQSITEGSVDQGKPGERRNRFLNHLLARFAEHFTDYSLMLQGALPEGEVTPSERLIKDKEAFLRRYPRVSATRGSAFNYLEPFGSENISGLEQRIRLKLGLVEADKEDFFIVEHILLRAMQEDEQQAVPFLAATRSKDPYSLQLSFVFVDLSTRFQNPGFRQLIEQTVRDETPAHLTPYVHWLEKDAMEGFKAAYRDWMEKLRRNWIT